MQVLRMCQLHWPKPCYNCGVIPRCPCKREFTWARSVPVSVRISEVANGPVQFTFNSDPGLNNFPPGIVFRQLEQIVVVQRVSPNGCERVIGHEADFIPGHGRSPTQGLKINAVLQCYALIQSRWAYSGMACSRGAIAFHAATLPATVVVSDDT